MSVSASEKQGAQLGGPRRLRIQYVSDIHLEFYDKRDKGKVWMTEFLTPCAPYLALCGDIGNPSRPAYRAFLAQCSAAFERIFVIPGNHEYYNFDQAGNALYSMKEKDAQARALCGNFSNVTWLQETAIRLEKEGVWICGATLWNDIQKEQEGEAGRTMNDYGTIRLQNSRKWTPADTRIEHKKQRGTLNYWIGYAAALGEPIVVLSHHLPSLKWIHPEFAKSRVNWCYASNCEELLRAPVIAWLCGHTHYPQSFWLKREEGDIFCGMNPWGYPFERIKERSKMAVFEWPRSSYPQSSPSPVLGQNVDDAEMEDIIFE